MIKICISKSSLQFIVEKLKKITFQYFFVIFYEDLLTQTRKSTKNLG